MARPFDGIRIMDLSMFMSGPLVTLLAADLGAEVIKVESVQRLDGWRGGGGAGNESVPAWEGSPSFNWINRNKRGITLNLADSRGADIFKRLVALSDAVVENYTPRVMRNFGLGYEDLRKVKPDIVMLSMPGFGADGPWRDYTAFAWSTEQMAGLNHITGYEGGPPLFTNTTGGDPLAGLMGAVALFSALHYRDRTGEGQYIDLSQLEASTWFAGDALVEAALTGRSPIRRGNRSEQMAPHNTYRCGDGRWVAIACRDDSDWARLAHLIGRADWAEAGQPFARLEGRIAALQAIERALNRWVAAQSAQEVARSCQQAGIPAGAVLDGKELSEDPHLAARHFFIAIERAGVGRKRYPGQPFQLSGSEPVIPTAAPTLGQHTREVLQSVLQIPEEQLAELEAADVTGSVPLAAR